MLLFGYIKDYYKLACQRGTVNIAMACSFVFFLIRSLLPLTFIKFGVHVYISIAWTPKFYKKKKNLFVQPSLLAVISISTCGLTQYQEKGAFFGALFVGTNDSQINVNKVRKNRKWTYAYLQCMFNLKSSMLRNFKFNFNNWIRV